MRKSALRSRPTRHCASCAAAGRTICIHGKGPERRTRLKPINKARAAMKYERNFGDHADNIRELPCWWCERPGPSEAAHADPRGMGGCGGDKTVLLPMCRDCHALFDDWKLAVDHDQAIADAKALHALMNPEDGDD